MSFFYFSMIVYYLQAVSRATKQRNAELRMQLQYERKEGRKNIFKMGAGYFYINLTVSSTLYLLLPKARFEIHIRKT